jgi:hypothetical protein
MVGAYETGEPLYDLRRYVAIDLCRIERVLHTNCHMACHSLVSYSLHHASAHHADAAGSSHNESRSLLTSHSTRHASPWGNFVTAISGSSSIVIARLTCIWRPNLHAVTAAAAAAAPDSVQFDIVCRHSVNPSGSSSNIVCIDVDAQSPATVRHIWCVFSDGSCHVVCASAAAAPAVSMSSSASGGGGGSITSSCRVAVLPRSSSEASRAAVYDGSAITMWCFSSGGLVALWKVGAKEGIQCLKMCKVSCDADNDCDMRETEVTRRSSRVLRNAGFAAVAASAGGGISVVVTVDAAAKSLLVCFLPAAGKSHATRQ